MGYKIDINMDDFREEIASDKHTLLENTKRFAKVLAEELVNYSTSETSLVVPGSPVNKAGNYIPPDGRTLRNAHPGGWADVTGQLANSIQSTVENHGSVKMIIQATAEYAAALDAKTGYSVLGGIEYVAGKYIRKYESILWEDL